MLVFLKRMAAAARSMFGAAAVSTRDSANSQTGSAPVQQGATVQPAQRPVGTIPVPLKITISKPEPIANPGRTAARDDLGTTSNVVVGLTPGTAPRTATQLRSQRRKLSPVAVQKTVGRSIARTPRPAKPAPRTAVRSNRISEDSVRMQAALMRSQRQREAARALARMKAMLPTATILTLQRAA